MYTVNTTKHVVAIFSEFNLVLNINHFSIPKQINEFFPLLHSAITFRAPVCIKEKKTATVSFAFISTGHICTGRHACTQIHIYQSFSLCVLLFPGGSMSSFLPKDGTRGPSPPAQTALYVQCRCSVLPATDVSWCWATDGASGETVDVWHKVSFKLERARRVSKENPCSTYRKGEG